MAYTRGSNANIIVGAAALFVSNYGKAVTSTTVPAAVTAESYKESLALRYTADVKNVGYTNNGIELTFTPTFGDVMVDQLLDVAKLYKSGMQVTLKTTLAEATLENLLLAIGQKTGGGTATGTASWTESMTLTGTGTSTSAATTTTGAYIDIVSGDLGDYPVERSLIAVGPGPAGKIVSSVASTDQVERVYVAYRAISIQNVSLSSKRDAATAFDVEFRLLPDDNGAYGKIIDRTY